METPRTSEIPAIATEAFDPSVMGGLEKEMLVDVVSQNSTDFYSVDDYSFNFRQLTMYRHQYGVDAKTADRMTKAWASVARISAKKGVKKAKRHLKKYHTLLKDNSNLEFDVDGAVETMSAVIESNEAIDSQGAVEAIANHFGFIYNLKPESLESAAAARVNAIMIFTDLIKELHQGVIDLHQFVTNPQFQEIQENFSLYYSGLQKAVRDKYS